MSDQSCDTDLVSASATLRAMRPSVAALRQSLHVSQPTAHIDVTRLSVSAPSADQHICYITWQESWSCVMHVSAHFACPRMLPWRSSSCKQLLRTQSRTCSTLEYVDAVGHTGRTRSPVAAAVLLAPRESPAAFQSLRPCNRQVALLQQRPTPQPIC